jgi:hypothetical protein
MAVQFLIILILDGFLAADSFLPCQPVVPVRLSPYSSCQTTPIRFGIAPWVEHRTSAPEIEKLSDPIPPKQISRPHPTGEIL